MMEKDGGVKVVLLGSEGVGKTCLVKYAIYEKFSQNEPNTVGASFSTKSVTLGDRTVSLKIWDTAGAERFRSISRLYFRNAKSALICFDVTSIETWQNVKYWIDEVRDQEPLCQLYLIGCKMDKVQLESIPQKVTTKMIEEYSEKVGAKWKLTSSQNGNGIIELFNQIALDYMRANPQKIEIPAGPSPSKNGQQRKGTCNC